MEKVLVSRWPVSITKPGQSDQSGDRHVQRRTADDHRISAPGPSNCIGYFLLVIPGCIRCIMNEGCFFLITTDLVPEKEIDEKDEMQNCGGAPQSQ